MWKNETGKQFCDDSWKHWKESIPPASKDNEKELNYEKIFDSRIMWKIQKAQFPDNNNLR